MGNPSFEDVSPIKNGGFSIAMLVYQRVIRHFLERILEFPLQKNNDPWSFALDLGPLDAKKEGGGVRP